jgi:hypothetical protein
MFFFFFVMPLVLSHCVGLVVCKGSTVMCTYPAEGTEEIANPFEDAEEEEQ